jgi:hypothetical protein
MERKADELSWRLKGRKENTYAIKRQEASKVKEIRFTVGPDTHNLPARVTPKSVSQNS